MDHIIWKRNVCKLARWIHVLMGSRVEKSQKVTRVLVILHPQPSQIWPRVLLHSTFPIFSWKEIKNFVLSLDNNLISWCVCLTSLYLCWKMLWCCQDLLVLKHLYHFYTISHLIVKMAYSHCYLFLSMVL